MPDYHGPCKAPREHRPPGCVRGRMKRACPFDGLPGLPDAASRRSPGDGLADADQPSTSYASPGRYSKPAAPSEDALRAQLARRAPETHCVREQLNCRRQQQQQHTASTSGNSTPGRRPVAMDIPLHEVCDRPRVAAAGGALRPPGAGRKFAAPTLNHNPFRATPKCRLAAADGRLGDGGKGSGTGCERGGAGEHGNVMNLRLALNEKEMQLVELRDQHVELVNRSAEARENYEEAIRCKDNVIHQLQEVINGKKFLCSRDREALQQAICQQRAELERKEMEVASLQAKLARQVQDFVEQQKIVCKLSSQLDAQEKERASQSQCLFVELEEMSGRLQELQTRLQDKDEVIESQRACCQELKSLVWRRECMIAQLQLSEQQLQSNLVKDSSAYEELKTTKLQLENENRVLEEHVCHLRHEIASFEEAGCHNVKLIKEKDDCIRGKECQLKQLRELLRAKEEELDSELGGQYRIRDEHQRMLEEYDCLKVQYDHIRSEHDHFKSECCRITEEYENLKVQCEVMRTQLEGLEFQQGQLDAARAQNEQMRSSLKTAQERLTALQLTISQAERDACIKRSTCMDVFTNELYENDTCGALASPTSCTYHSPRSKMQGSEANTTPSSPTCPLLSPKCPVLSTPCPVLSKPCPVLSKPCPVLSKPCSVLSKPCPVLSKPCPVLSKPCPVLSKPCPVLSKPCPVLSKPCPVLSKPCPSTSKASSSKPCSSPDHSSPKLGPHSKVGGKTAHFAESPKTSRITTPGGRMANPIAVRKQEQDARPSSSRKRGNSPTFRRGVPPSQKRDTSPSRSCCLSPQRLSERSPPKRDSAPRFGSCLSRTYGQSSPLTRVDECTSCSNNTSSHRQMDRKCYCNIRCPSHVDCSSDQEMKNLQEEIFNRERGWRHTEAKMRAELCRRLEQVHDAYYQNNACKRSYARSYIQSQANKAAQRPQWQHKKVSHCPCPS